MEPELTCQGAPKLLLRGTRCSRLLPPPPRPTPPCTTHRLNVPRPPAAGGAKRDWLTGESVFGRLAGGHVVSVSLGHARRLLDAQCAVLAAAGAAIPFEVAVGVNGMVWVQAAAGECRLKVDAALPVYAPQPRAR